MPTEIKLNEVFNIQKAEAAEEMGTKQQEPRTFKMGSRESRPIHLNPGDIAYLEQILAENMANDFDIVEYTFGGYMKITMTVENWRNHYLVTSCKHDDEWIEVEYRNRMSESNTSGG